MPLRECKNKHLYNGDKHGDTCPICGVTLKKDKLHGKTQEEIAAFLKIPDDKCVCAWIVCIEGVNRGLSYPIHPGNNFVGGEDDMDIQILGDPKISLNRHTTLVHEPKKCETMILPGEGKGIVYLEEKPVYTPQKLKAEDVIELGDSKFKFIPFCCDNFQW